MANRSEIISFIKSIISYRGDLSTVSAPTFLLHPYSYLEYASRWASQPSRFVAPAKEPDPAKRVLLVLKWFLSTIKPRLNYWGDEAQRPWAKKPLNPFLGEVFLGCWEDEESGRTEMVVEQVGHHPPCTAICVSNVKYGVKLQGSVSLRSHFSGSSIVIDNIGHMSLHLDTYNEDYIITLCPGIIKGLLTGRPYPDLAGDITIHASTGFTAHATFSGKGWLSGKRNNVEATVAHSDKNALYSIQGCWLNELMVKDAVHNTVLEIVKYSLSDQTPMTTLPIPEQDPWESHRAWQATADAINAGAASVAGAAKACVENGQRQMRIKEREEGRVWKAKFFVMGPPSEFLADLVSKGHIVLDENERRGVWRLDESAKDAARPFHPGMTPEGLV